MKKLKISLYKNFIKVQNKFYFLLDVEPYTGIMYELDINITSGDLGAKFVSKNKFTKCKIRV